MQHTRCRGYLDRTIVFVSCQENISDMFSMVVYTLCAVLVIKSSLFVPTLEDLYDNVDDLIALGRYACPHLSFCSGNGTESHLNSNYTCCNSCSCRPDCAQNRNCCPDVIDLPYTGDPLESEDDQECALAYYSNLYFGSIQITNKQRIRYKTVMSCPDGTSCQFPYRPYLTYDLNDLVFVHSNEDGRIYRNSKCAQCNNATSIVE